MKQYQVYIRKTELGPWQYGDTFQDPNIAWQAMMLCRTKGFATKVSTGTIGVVTGMDTDVLGDAHG